MNYQFLSISLCKNIKSIETNDKYLVKIWSIYVTRRLLKTFSWGNH